MYFYMMDTLFRAGELALTYKREAPDLHKLTSSSGLYEFIKPYFGDTIEVQESFYIIGLSRSNHIRSVFRLSSGGAAGTVADPKLIFARLLLDNCAAFIMAHNHPSGNPQPSMADRRLTENCTKAGKVLDLPCLDHIIVTTSTYTSFADKGLIC